MGAPRVTPEEIVKMLRLYARLGNYAEVGRQMGRSGSTVAKYVQMKGVPQSIRIAVQNLSQQNQ
ncbi:MAG: helix-turn-helix domain-containing protein [Ruminococcaceae bacterium]|nr:helix-turn-helix domain-containing protein [Oscillospiraceae bacterium]